MNEDRISRWDTDTMSDDSECKSVSDRFSKSYKEYNTVIKVKDGYIATNKYDPRVKIDKFSQVNPEL